MDSQKRAEDTEATKPEAEAESKEPLEETDATAKPEAETENEELLEATEPPKPEAKTESKETSEETEGTRTTKAKVEIESEELLKDTDATSIRTTKAEFETESEGLLEDTEATKPEAGFTTTTNSNFPAATGKSGNDWSGSSDESGPEDGLELDLHEGMDIPVTGFAVASNKRNADFHELFPTIPEEDYLIEGASRSLLCCAWGGADGVQTTGARCSARY